MSSNREGPLARRLCMAGQCARDLRNEIPHVLAKSADSGLDELFYPALSAPCGHEVRAVSPWPRDEIDSA